MRWGSDYGGMYGLRRRELLIIGMRWVSDSGDMYGLRWRELLINGMRLGSDYGGLHGLRWRELLIIGMSRGSVIMEVSTVWLKRDADHWDEERVWLWNNIVLRWRELLIIGMRWGSDYGGMYGLRRRELLIIGMRRGLIMEVCMDGDEESCWSLGWVGVWLWRYVWIEMKRDADHWDEEGYDLGGMYGLRWRELLIIELCKDKLRGCMECGQKYLQLR
jgi:hypothetical protein